MHSVNIGNVRLTSVVDSNGKVYGLTNLLCRYRKCSAPGKPGKPRVDDLYLGAAVGPASRRRDVARRLWARRKLSVRIVHLRSKG